MASTASQLLDKSRIYSLSIYRSLYPMRAGPRKKIKRLHLPTHYVEVSYKLRKAVVFYVPNIAHIPHGIKGNNLLFRTMGASRGQNT
ncbi:hypothetical protein ZOSMA_267G00080 [Zostera marina]|uniref:Uncharacterized protein n=1 Tax=Zostera marina TaxID=29655 RepID=A0A0K9PGT8_ZOSMR|nr:hypothetical protein ZOSMA_267G00080 [Zostera marina]